jgi:hypothetical protein
MLEQLGDGERLKPKGGSDISRETLETLNSCWRSSDGERDMRISSEVHAEAAIGMNSIFQLLQGKTARSSNGISDQHMSDDLEELVLQDVHAVQAAQNRGVVMGGRHEKDVWNTIFHATDVTQQSWLREAEGQEYHFIPARQRDYTESGYCLEFEKARMEPFQVGELIGVKAGSEAVLNLCMVRWLVEDEGTISAGLMRLTDSMEPALVVVHYEERRTALNCLLGIGKDHRPQLFLPHLPGIKSKRIFLVVDGKEVLLTLSDRVVISPLFDAFHFHAASVVADEEISLEQMNSQLHGLTQPIKEREEDSTDFSDLWSSL